MKKQILFIQKLLLEHLTTFFVKISPNIASKIPKSDRNFEAYINKANTKPQENPLLEDNVLEAFKSLKTNKGQSFDEIDVIVIKQIYNHIKKPLISIFSDSIKLEAVPQKLKLAKVAPIFKSEKNELLTTNYRPILVLPYFSKILERIICNKFYEYLTKNNLLLDKQFWGHSTEHPLIELANREYDSFNENKYTLGVFIDLLKAYDTVKHNILLKKLKLYGIENINLKCFTSYLSRRKQNIKHKDITASYHDITCRAPQGSILGSLLFIICINDLYNASNTLQAIIFAGDANLFSFHCMIKDPFNHVNLELNLVGVWFKAYKLSLNERKTKYTFFHKFRQKGNIPLKLSKLSSLFWYLQ